MKIKLTVILSLLACSLFAQVDRPALISFAQGVNDSKQIVVGVSPSYAPDLKINGTHKAFGGSVFGLYPLNDYLFTGLRFDYLGDSFFSGTADVGVKGDVQILGHNFTPFAITGASSPFQGAGNDTLEVGAIIGTGVYTTLWQNEAKTISIDAAFETEKNTLFDGLIYHPVVALNWKF